MKTDKIFFKRIKVIGKPVKVDFYTKTGEKVVFKPNIKVSKPKIIKFYKI